MRAAMSNEASFLISLAAAMFFLGVTCLLFYEAWAFRHGQAPITYVVRSWMRGQQLLATVFWCLITGLFVHFCWVVKVQAGNPPASPPAVSAPEE